MQEVSRKVKGIEGAKEKGPKEAEWTADVGGRKN